MSIFDFFKSPPEPTPVTHQRVQETLHELGATVVYLEKEAATYTEIEGIPVLVELTSDLELVIHCQTTDWDLSKLNGDQLVNWANTHNRAYQFGTAWVKNSRGDKPELEIRFAYPTKRGLADEQLKEVLQLAVTTGVKNLQELAREYAINPA